MLEGAQSIAQFVDAASAKVTLERTQVACVTRGLSNYLIFCFFRSKNAHPHSFYLCRFRARSNSSGHCYVRTYKERRLKGLGITVTGAATPK